jgi:protein-S-isoprenylcysteine O-methyltransferase Ste14
MVTTILAYLVIGVFFATEGRARKGQQAHKLDRGEFDQRSTIFIGVALFITSVGLLLAPVLNHFDLEDITFATVVGWVGLAIAVSGIALRLWANRTLGQFYTRTLLVTENQPVVRQGPYRLIRHPGYLGSILMWAGAGLATTNWVAVTVAVVVMFAAYVYRIQAEEAMLMTASNKDYGDYTAHTWKLIPFVY